MQASEKTYSEIVQADPGDKHYRVPKYQRAYSWETKHWLALYDDINDNVDGHFIGSIICINDNREREPGHDIVYELIDGQQRLTTLSLLLAGLYEKLSSFLADAQPNDKYDEDSLEKVKGRCYNIGSQLVRKLSPKAKPQHGTTTLGDGQIVFLRVQPSSQDNNEKDYLDILLSCGILGKEKRKSLDELKNPQHLMVKAYKYLHKRLPDDIDELIGLANKINQLELIHISADSHANAFRLFETLNNRGKSLTAADIIKNKMLFEMERQCKSYEDPGELIDEAYDKWQTMLEHIKGVEDRFFAQFYNASKHEKDIGVSHYKLAGQGNLIAIYERIVEANPRHILENLVEKAEVYEKIIGRTVQADDDKDLWRAFVELERIDAAPSYTLLMYLMTLEDEHFAKSNTLLEIVHFLQKYFVRRNITGFPPTNQLTRLQVDVIEACVERINDKKTLDTHFVAGEYCKGRGKPQSLQEFKDKLSDNLFVHSRYMTRYVLAKLDECGHSREYKPDLWAKGGGSNQDVWTVEHILPQGKKIPNEWTDTIADGDADLAAKVQEEYVHCLGNLTLSGYNSKLARHSLKRKQSKATVNILGHEINIGYNNGLYLNRLPFQSKGKKESLASVKQWKQEDIEERNTEMARALIKLYKFANEKVEDIDWYTYT